MEKNIFHELTDNELNAKLETLKQELYGLRFNHATGQLTNPNLLVKCKRDIARVMTEQRARKIGINTAKPKKA